MLKAKVVGYVEAKKILDQLTNHLQKRILLSSLRASCKPMLNSAKSKVPVKSGTLKQQLKIVRFRDRYSPKSEVSVAVKPVYQKHRKSGAVNQYYGRFVHDGTDDRKAKKGKFLVFENKKGETIFAKKAKGIKPNPYLAKAYNETNTKTVNIFGDELAKATERFINKNYKPIK